MKRKSLLLIAALCVLLAVPQKARANDFLEKSKHYSAYASGVDKIHFKIPLFSESEAGYSYFVSTKEGWWNSYIYYDLKGANPQKDVAICYISSGKDLADEYDSYSYGTAKIKMVSGHGIIEITNIHGGKRSVVADDGQWHSYFVTKNEESDNDDDNVTWLEMDWYPQEALAERTIDVGVHVNLCRFYSPNDRQYVKDWHLASGLSGGQNIIQAQLFTPYFYAVNELGPTGYGSAAVPYTVFYDPKEYTTSQSNEVVLAEERSGNIIATTSDTVQEFFATFKVIRTKKPQEVISTQVTTKQDIKPYHRIYDLTVTEELDATGTYTGNNLLEWHIKNPKLRDLVDGDYFEVQRATQPDFSDAKQLAVLPMTRSDSTGIYQYVDKSRDTWSGNALKLDTTISRYSVADEDYILKDDNGNFLARLDISIYSDEYRKPSIPVYYRVRRASSSIWGWVENFSQKDTLEKHNFLAPLDSVQADYTLDPEYETNRKVHFNIHLDNSPVASTPLIPRELCTYNCSIKHVLMDVTINLSYNPCVDCSTAVMDTSILELRIKDADDGSIIQDWTHMPPGEYTFPANSIMEGRAGSAYFWQKLLISTSGSVRIEGYAPSRFYSNGLYSFVYNKIVPPEIDSRLDNAKEDLYNRLNAKYQLDASGRCMWDRTAKLVLQRTIQETGYTSEIIIPQDSIRRLADGSWMASFTDVANTACAHINYAVRIDQTSSDLQVLNTDFLKPVAIHGPSLYFDEAATITSFTASQGAAVGQQKRGVLLSWVPSSVAVDSYSLTRVAKNSDAAADTIYTGQDNSFFDETAVPNQHYEYVVTAHYYCNGKTSDNSASAEGWRSPYGEISGSVLMPDNSGMAGVTVALEGPDGSTVKTMTTGSDGTFLFDSLSYDIGASTQYAVVPAHTYAQFSYNYTSAQSASVTLSADNAVTKGVSFMNTSTARLTGRALYKLSTIPVAGAMFTLNGDTLLRSGTPLQTGTDGNFELTLTKGQPYTLRIFKPGHTFEGEGILHVEEGTDTFALTKPLDGVRFYDMTKVRLVGRVAGGIDQRDLPEAFGLGTNNIGDNVQLVLQLEGDNVAHFVHDPNDLSRDTIQQTIAHEVWTSSTSQPRIVGTTNMLIEKKRITIHPDPQTGEYQVDLFPVKYKVIQASAQGYATLFTAGAGNENFDLTNAPLQSYDVVRDNDSVHYNAVYDRIYRTPVKVHLTQMLYGLEQDGYGEQSIDANSINPNIKEKVPLYTKQEDGTVNYTMGYPLFYYNRRYQFEAQAYEDYYYNNDPTQRLDRVPQRGGSVTVRNGMHNSTSHTTYELNQQGKNRNVWLTVDHIQTQTYGEDALSTVSVALEYEGNTVETDAFRAYVLGDIAQGNELTATEAGVTLLDIVRDPGGNGSSAWIENGTTYTYSYNESYDWKAGVNLTPTWGLNVSHDIGTVTAPEGAGSYYGANFTNSKQFSFTVPIVHEWSWGYKYTYQFTTSERISTSSKKNKTGIGSNADVFVGATMSQLTGKAKSVAIINDSLYQARQPAIQAGTIHVHASGTGADGRPYYLVTGEKVVMGSVVSNTFAYSQYYILETVIPQLALQRQSLLMRFPDSTAAQAAADAMNEPVYWYIDSTTAVSLQDTLARGSYRIFLPTGSTKVYPDRIAALDNTIVDWLGMIVLNEREKVIARQSGQHVGTYSVSFGNTLSHTDNYAATANYNEAPQGDMFAGEGEKYATQMGQQMLMKTFQNLGDFFGDDQVFGTAVSEALNQLKAKKDQDDNELELGTVSNTSKFKMKWEPVISFNSSSRTNTDQTNKKSCGFTLAPDDQGDITVSVYRAPQDSLWRKKTAVVMDNVDYDENRDVFGSYVFFTEAGATYCIHEKEEKTKFYNKGTIINNPTMAIAVPEMSIDRYEVSNVPSNQRAVFHLELKNEGQVQFGFPSTGTGFSLSLTGDSNPHGAKVYINGAPLSQGLNYFLLPGQVISQVMEVERGEVDDYENLSLYFNVGDCMKTYAFLNFSVHFLPESSPVNIASPRPNWVMNTLSQHDSVGYYLPVDIDGFNIHHKNFDHIEFQYKLTKESDEMWVNLCSFYADDSLYNLATGNKAMIENGRIQPFRFYGERDPMEQEYDLRAVSFCRFGSGFVSKASPVISGVKDTRPPVLFGEAEPANAILGIGDNLKLRFSEPIAGNYLDEDNNFQLKGVTNETGITAGTAIHFNGTADSYAHTEISRSLTGKSFSLDMLVRPANPYNEETFFSYSVVEGVNLLFGKTADNRLFIQVGQERITSRQLESPMLEFTRVIMAFDNDTKTVRFYTGTTDVTDPATGPLPDETVLSASSPLIYGLGYTGDMLEARLWTKALTLDEIAATNGHYLTGYERELLAYYRMNEGKGDVMIDKANGANLYLSGTTWKLQKGISLKLQNDSVELAGNLLARSANYDETLMFWFKTLSADAPLFRAGWFATDSTATGTLLAFENGKLMLHSAANQWQVGDGLNDGEWHHFALSINRSYNTAAVFIDGQITNTAGATKFAAVSGAMYLGGQGFEGNVDELAVFEQSLPASMVQDYYNASPVGDEMGLMGYLPFEEQRLNANGILEQFFSVNDRREFRDRTTGQVLDKVVPLVLTANAASHADKIDYAPTSDKGLLSKLNFGWTFNQEELLINLRMQDSEVNKQNIYITVRDVEDLHGNPMPSPVSWTAFVDRCPLRWDLNTQSYFTYYGEMSNEPGTLYCYQDIIINTTGKRHQFKIESLPDWLTVDQEYGSIEPLESKALHFCPDYEMPVGVYTDIVYLTDEDGLSEPLYVEYTVEARCPWESSRIDQESNPNTMSLRGQVYIESEYGIGYYDSDELDQVAVFCDGELVGLANNTFADKTNTSYVYLTIYGNNDMNGKPLSFKLWQASTGKIYNLTPSARQKFQANALSGISPEEPIRLSTSAGEIQQLSLLEGWNWVSMYIRPISDKLDYLFTIESGFSEGDLIKSPSGQSFAELTVTPDTAAWRGKLTSVNYKNMYMMRTRDGFNTTVEGKALTDDQRTLTICKGWNAIAYLLSEPASTRDALADYYDKATVGDLIKSRTQFAVFTENGKWEGSLQTLRPGQGYLFRRLGDGYVTMKYVKKAKTSAPLRANRASETDNPTPMENAFSNPAAASNMTMIARIENGEQTYTTLRAYIGDELVGVATPLSLGGRAGEGLYFLTIQSDRSGTLRFETEDGTILTPSPCGEARGEVLYAPDAHAGSIESPVVLMPMDNTGVYKVFEDGHIIIIRDGERFDLTGKKL